MEDEMIFLTIVVYIVLMIFLWRTVFGKNKGVENKVNNMIFKLNELKDTHEEQVDKNKLTIRLFYLLFLLFCFSLFIIGSIFINYLIKIPKGYELLELNSQGFILLPILFLSLCSIGLVIYPFFSKKFLVRSYLLKIRMALRLMNLLWKMKFRIIIRLC